MKYRVEYLKKMWYSWFNREDRGDEYGWKE